ncbi:MAG: histidine kinase [Acidobacteria bacterium]|nr:histidine kinase [Acidobacteriota bacterium]
MNPILRSRAALGTYLLGWVPVVGLLLGTGMSQGWPLVEALALTVPLAFGGAMLFLTSWYLCVALPISTFKVRNHGVAWTLSALLMGNIWWLMAWGLAEVLGRTPFFPDVVARTRVAWVFFFAMGVLLYLATLALHYLLQALAREREAERRAGDLQVLAREAELKALRAQLNPHFLFNSLNSISALTSVDPGRAREMCVLLSDFLRKSLKLGERPSVTLAEELDILEAYLAIERIRFGARLGVERELDPAAAEVGIPPLLLQPLVENAIKHGIAALPEGGQLRIATRLQGAEVEIRLENPLDPDSPRPKGLGMGLRQVRERLLKHFGGRARLEAEASEGRFKVRAMLPVREVEE